MFEVTSHINHLKKKTKGKLLQTCHVSQYEMSMKSSITQLLNIECATHKRLELMNEKLILRLNKYELCGFIYYAIAQFLYDTIGLRSNIKHKRQTPFPFAYNLMKYNLTA